MTITTETETRSSGPSMIVQIVVLLALTAAAAGIGWTSGMFLETGQPAEAGKSGPTEGVEADAAKSHDGPRQASATQANIVDLPAITTNLAVPDTIWMRLEMSLVLDHSPDDPALINAIHQDLMAYIRTVKLQQIEGPSGYLYLKSDLLERASIRSDGLVKDILIRTMLVE